MNHRTRNSFVIVLFIICTIANCPTSVRGAASLPCFDGDEAEPGKGEGVIIIPSAEERTREWISEWHNTLKAIIPLAEEEIKRLPVFLPILVDFFKLCGVIVKGVFSLVRDAFTIAFKKETGLHFLGTRNNVATVTLLFFLNSYKDDFLKTPGVVFAFSDKMDTQYK